MRRILIVRGLRGTFPATQPSPGYINSDQLQSLVLVGCQNLALSCNFFHLYYFSILSICSQIYFIFRQHITSLLQGCHLMVRIEV